MKNQLLNHLLSYSSLRKRNSGFTLIELIIVIAVIAVLFTALISVIDPREQFKKSRDAHRKNDMAQIQRGLEAYYQDHGRYPDSSTDHKIISVADGVTATISWGTSWAPYMELLPKDPARNAYAYFSPSSSNGQTYYLFASLERGKNDPGVCNNGLACTNVPPNVPSSESPCVDICNFGMSSPDVKP